MGGGSAAQGDAAGGGGVRAGIAHVAVHGLNSRDAGKGHAGDCQVSSDREAAQCGFGQAATQGEIAIPRRAFVQHVLGRAAVFDSAGKA